MKYFIYQYGENNCVSAVVDGVRRQGCGAYEIERRPRGASRHKAAPTFVATCRTCQAMVARLGACLETGEATVMPTLKLRRTNKADQVRAQD
ncbi:hypothetical protein [Pseudomonas sp. NMI760_13]|uniref:hypothetical protein n=1 Tax=Pseudomonas sp. NMI760_13 TaxID=2903147 RepID=UPI001E4273BD|nr:hypothetical protein [Pseudomonas sp. NMI760_13]MCE0914218.1 hypothetical protein [Pseudomonas sp. NMI760_13]MDC0689815.1 hypothetical protein [Mitsuaria sp. RG]